MGKQQIIRIGTRGSALALAQAQSVQRALKRRFPKILFQLVKIKTTGDQYQSVEIFKKKGIGVFTKELEKGLLSGRIDIAVHSLKDLPTALPRGLVLAAIPKRLDTRDAIVSKQGYTLKTLPHGAVVGTGSLRRRQQLLRLRPDLKVVELRGNLDTRVAKVIKEKKMDAVVLAQAGFLRLNRFKRFLRPILPEQMLPAVGQGALGIQTALVNKPALTIARTLNDANSEKQALSERAFLNKLQGGCRIPAGIRSVIRSGRLELSAAVFSVKNSHVIEARISGPASRYHALGEMLAGTLLKKGAKRLLREARA